MSTDNKHLAEFIAKHDLQLDNKLLKYLHIIAIDCIHKNITDINHKSIKQLAKSSKNSQYLKHELQCIKNELGKITKHFNEDNDPKWWSSPPLKESVPKTQPSPVAQPNNQITRMPPRPNKFKHHLDDSEIKKALQYDYIPQESTISYRRQCESVRTSNRQCETSVQTDQMKLEEISQIARNQSVETISKQNNSDSIQKSEKQVECSYRQYSPQFKYESEKKMDNNNQVQQFSYQKKRNSLKKQKKANKENKNPQQKKVPCYLKNVQSKIKQQISQDRSQFQLEKKDYCSSQTTFQIHDSQTNDEMQMTNQLDPELKLSNEMMNLVPGQLTSKNPLNSNPFETLDDYLANESALYQCQTAQSVFLTSSNNKKSLSSGKVQFKTYDLETAKKHLSQPNMNLENSNKIVELANSFLNSPFMKQLWSDSLNKQKVFKGLSNIKEKGISAVNLNGYQDGSWNQEYHSSSSSNFSLFNPKEELKHFFQKEFAGKQEQDQQSNVSFTE